MTPEANYKQTMCWAGPCPRIKTQEYCKKTLNKYRNQLNIMVGRLATVLRL